MRRQTTEAEPSMKMFAPTRGHRVFAHVPIVVAFVLVGCASGGIGPPASTAMQAEQPSESPVPMLPMEATEQAESTGAMRPVEPAQPIQPSESPEPMQPAESMELAEGTGSMEPVEPTEPMHPVSAVPLGQVTGWRDNPLAEDLRDHWDNADGLQAEVGLSELSDSAAAIRIDTLTSIVGSPRG